MNRPTSSPLICSVRRHAAPRAQRTHPLATTGDSLLRIPRGKKVMLPAGFIREIDVDNETVYVNRTKDQIKNVPEFDESLATDEDYRTQLGSYYGAGSGYRDWESN
jgi:hypothetical protein